MISNADTVGVFQIESRAQMSMLPRLRPRCFYDLVIEVAIVRPGPIQGNMVHPYLRRRNGEEPVEYPSEALRQVLEKTLGVPLFQEQAMKVAMVGAGFSADEADKLRRAMAAWKRGGAVDAFEKKIIEGMLKNGYTREFAEKCFLQIRGFGEYGFPESHAASFAHLVYVSAWLKRYHPAAFAAALLNSQPMGFYAPAQIVRDAKEHGVEVRGVDVNESEWDGRLERRHEATEARRHEGEKRDGGTEGRRDGGEQRDKGEERHEGTKARRHEGEEERDGGTACAERSRSKGQRDRGEDLRAAEYGFGFWSFGFDSSFEFRHSDFRASGFCASDFRAGEKENWGAGGPAVRLGFRMIKGLREEFGKRIVEARGSGGAFQGIAEMWRRTGLPRHAMQRLAEADAFASMRLSRRQALWEVMALKDDQAPLFDGVVAPPEATAALPVMPLGQEVLTDYETAGLSLKKHPVALVRAELAQKKIITSAELNRRQRGWVKVAGLVLIRQRPATASGIVFETLEDETGVVNLVIRPDVYDRCRAAARHATLVQADGYVERQGQVIHVMVKRMFDLSELLEGYSFKSRDFH